MKKSIILIIAIAIVLMLTMYLTSTAASFSLGSSYNMGYAYAYQSKIDDGVTMNLFHTDYYDYFCANRNAQLGDYSVAYSLKNVAQVTIKGDTASIKALKSNGGTYSNSYTESGTISNRVLALVYYKIKDGKSYTFNQVNPKDSAVKDNGNPNDSYRYSFEILRDNYTLGSKITKPRERYIQYTWKGDYTPYGALNKDYGQIAIWKSMSTWHSNAANKLDTAGSSLWGSYVGTIQSGTPITSVSGADKEYVKEYARRVIYGYTVYDEAYDEAKDLVDNEYGIEEQKYKSTNKRIEGKINGDYCILGPFQYKFNGSLKANPTLTFDSSSTSQSYTIGTYSGSTFTETNKIVSGQQFYIRVKTSNLNSVKKINFDFQVDGISLFNTTTNIYFFKRTTDGTYQSLMKIEQTEGYNTAFKDSYEISKPVNVSIKKLDLSGNALKAEGIKFQIKNNANAVVAYFKTDANGNGVVTNSSGTATGATSVVLMTNHTYTLVETTNNEYGYKNCYLGKDAITIAGASSITQSGKNIKFTLGNESANNVTIKAKNSKQLEDLEIVKTGEDGTKLENVSFIVSLNESSETRYLRLKDKNNNIVSTVKDTGDKVTYTIADGTKKTLNNKDIVINSNNVANDTEYHVEYVSKKANATKFVTSSNGKAVIKNLEINKSSSEKYSYTAYEVYNLSYGYGAKENVELSGSLSELKLNEVNEIKFTNTQALGNLKLEKYDEDNHQVILPNVGFVVEISSSSSNEHGYLTLYNKAGEIVGNPSENIITINKNNKANDNEYRVDYYKTNKHYKDLSDEQKEKITIFKTGADATLAIKNLEVYSPDTTEKYTYKFVEVSNDNYGYVASYQEIGNLQLTKNETLTKGLGNKLIYTKISGYVWLENPYGKENEYDNVYTIDTDDIILKKYEEGKLVIEEPKKTTEEPKKTTVEIQLHNIKTGEVIRALPDEFDTATGKYTFTYVKVAELQDYEVVFVYDGFYYTTVATELEKAEGSKVKEVPEERKTLNNKFASVEDKGHVLSEDGTINTAEYAKDDNDRHISKLSSLNFDTSISANTNVAGYKIDERHATVAENSKGTMQTLENVNMGIVLREQPKISINSDIYSALIEFEGYKYNYKYNGRQNYYENKNDDNIGVKFEQEYTLQRYTRTVYASDIQAAVDYNKEVKLSITYKIQLANESKTLSVMPKQIINYFDSRYTIEKVGLGLDETNHIITDELAYSEAKNVEGLEGKYKSTVITFEKLIDKETSVKDLYITFSVDRTAIVDLLNQKSTYHNASEIISYATCYGNNTFEAGSAGNREENALYAGIDKMSEPGNMELVLTDYIDKDGNVDGTQILDTTNYEDDSTSAPSLILEAAESRKISGTIFEDIATVNENNEKLGDGIFNEGEKVIKNVKVELHYVNEDGTIGEIAKYSNGEEVTATTDEDGNYTFGYYNENTKKHVGILPGKYVVKFIYNNESYIVGNRNINIDDYKSTIITSEAVKNGFEANADNQRWYTIDVDTRYSDARDDLSLRGEYGNVDFTLTNSTYNETMKLENMNAYTPIMDIGIEFTEFDESDVLTLNLVKEFKNLDFGIVERPVVDIIIEKEITGLEIVSQNGTSIIPYGNPLDGNMQYVKKLPGVVSAEIESDLLQGAELKLEYTITVKNNSNKDYFESEYYYYGTGGNSEIITRAEKVVDYISATLVLDSEKNEALGWVKVNASDLANAGLISTEAISDNYNILTTTEFSDVAIGEEKSVKLYAGKYLAVSDLTREENRVEVIEITGTRAIKDAIPGNYVPTDSGNQPNEIDEARIDLVITPPTGTMINYILYITAAIAAVAILTAGIVIIKKKLVK